MEFYIPKTKAELSQRKLEEYSRFEKITNWGRQNPIQFITQVFDIQMIDYQSWVMGNMWHTPFVCLLEARGAGKDTQMAIFLMAKMMLIPDYKIYVSSNTHPQSVESFKKIEDIALQRLPSFKNLNDIFQMELERGANNPSGFSHSPHGHTFRLINNSELLTLSSNLEGVRGKRGSVWFNEVGWLSAEALAVVENFANVDSNFSTSTSKIKWIEPQNMPLQLLYTSSASDCSMAFYDKYKTFSKRMIMGDSNYFVCDIDAYDVLNYSTINGEKITAHLTEENIAKAFEEDSDLAERELLNKFRRGSGANALVPMELLVKNSEVRLPLFYNDTGKRKFIFTIDSARAHDNSAMTIWELYETEEKGLLLRLVNVISLVDKDSRKKTPLPMPEQVAIIHEQMLKYNGEDENEWDNIEIYIDAGAGGGGLGSIADQLLLDWTDAQGQTHRGLVDSEHPQHETAKVRYPNAVRGRMHLIEPIKYRKIIFDSLEKMMRLGVMSFMDYDNREYLLFEDAKTGELIPHTLTDEEKIALVFNNLAKTEISYMCKYDTPNGGITYDLEKSKRNTLHDDMAYSCALAAYALAEKRRRDLVNKPVEKSDFSAIIGLSRRPDIYSSHHNMRKTLAERRGGNAAWRR